MILTRKTLLLALSVSVSQLIPAASAEWEEVLGAIRGRSFANPHTLINPRRGTITPACVELHRAAQQNQRFHQVLDCLGREEMSDWAGRSGRVVADQRELMAQLAQVTDALQPYSRNAQSWASIGLLAFAGFGELAQVLPRVLQVGVATVGLGAAHAGSAARSAANAVKVHQAIEAAIDVRACVRFGANAAVQRTAEAALVRSQFQGFIPFNRGDRSVPWDAGRLSRMRADLTTLNAGLRQELLGYNVQAGRQVIAGSSPTLASSTPATTGGSGCQEFVSSALTSDGVQSVAIPRTASARIAGYSFSAAPNTAVTPAQAAIGSAAAATFGAIAPVGAGRVLGEELGAGLGFARP